MAEVMLEAARIHSASRKGVAGRVPEHMDVDRERQLGGFAGAFDHARDAHAAERLATLVDEDVVRPAGILGVGSP